MLDVLLDTVLDSAFAIFIFDLSFYGGIGTSYGKQAEPEDTVRRKMGTCVGRSARCDSAVRVFGSGIEPFCRKSHHGRNSGRYLFVHFG